MFIFALPSVASIPKERPADLVRDSAPAACNAFGLTPQAAARERRETARRELEAREAMRTAQQLRSIASRSLNPLMPAGATPPAMTISSADLVRASAGSRIMVTTAVISANEQLNARKYYFYDPEGHLISETETTTGSNPAIEWEYIWFGDTPVAQIHTPTNEIAYYFTDHLGTPIIQTNQQGDVIWHAEYEPFGTIFAIRAGEDRYQPLRFPGMIADIGNPDVYYNMHRYYRSSWGRYTQPDPLFNLDLGVTLRQWLAEPPTPNFHELSWYEYGQNNPLTYLDPLGLKVKNDTNCRLYVKESTTSKVHPLYPGQEWPGPQDGYADPCKHPGFVFKTADGVDVNVGPDHQPNTSAGGVISTVGQIIKGGWKDQDWQKNLHKKEDKGWDPLFDKSQPGKCLCCATTP
jgi:RHS repeat-associated protein